MKAVSALVAQQPTGSMRYPVARAANRRGGAASNQSRFEVTGPKVGEAASGSFSVFTPGFFAALLMLVLLAGVAGWMLRQLFNLWFG